MRSWEKRDIVDVLKDHHRDLIKASKELANGGDNEGSNEIDNDAERLAKSSNKALKESAPKEIINNYKKPSPEKKESRLSRKTEEKNKTKGDQ